ncbi:hypothetical protein WDW37_09320 [Bdellovibrionota bacterium FG-1]
MKKETDEQYFTSDNRLSEKGKTAASKILLRTNEEIQRIGGVSKAAVYKWNAKEKPAPISPRGKSAFLRLIQSIDEPSAKRTGKAMSLSQVATDELIRELKRRGARQILF